MVGRRHVPCGNCRMNALSALLKFKDVYPSCAIHMPNDREYCELNNSELLYGHKKWVRYAKWFNVWKFMAQRTDCDDVAYEYSNYFHRLYNNPLVVVVFDFEMQHAYIALFHSETSWRLIEPRKQTLSFIQNAKPTRLERV